MNEITGIDPSCCQFAQWAVVGAMTYASSPGYHTQTTTAPWTGVQLESTTLLPRWVRISLPFHNALGLPLGPPDIHRVRRSLLYPATLYEIQTLAVVWIIQRPFHSD